MTKSKKIRMFVFLGVVAVVLVLFVVASVKRKGGKTVVQTEKAAKGLVTAMVSGSAKIQPEVQVKISAKVSGQILRIGVQEGDRVKKGQFLAQLDQEFYKAEVEQSTSNMKFARAGFEKAQNEYERVKKLFNGQLASMSELEIAKSTFEQAKAQVEQSEAMAKQSQDNLSKTTIFAPMDGVVSQVNKKQGEMAMGSQFSLDVIMVVADLSKMQAETDIDENDVVNVSLGDTAKIAIDAFPDTTFKGVVKEIANTGTVQGQGTQEQVTNFLVKVFMVEKPPTVRPSMSSTVDIITDAKAGVIKLPIQCVTVREPVAPKPDPKAKAAEKAKAKKDKKDKKDKKGQKADTALADAGRAPGDTTKADSSASGKKPAGPSKPAEVVFVVKDGVVRQVAVKSGISSDTDIEIVSGLSDGDEVVSGPYRVLSKSLKDGDKVTVNNAMKSAPRGNSEGEGR